ncbi:putative transcriptional regulator [Bacillus sp. TS-2]|nr:putative transcriptional regulator [Bacillus sp. TS-2]
METIGTFAKRINVTVRTLRYYDDIGILKPQSTNAQGHKLYGKEEEKILLRIQAWKFLGISLDEIKPLLDENKEHYSFTLSLQKKLLMEQKERLETMIEAVEDAEQIVEVSEGKAVEYMDILFMVVNMYRLEREQKNFLVKHFSKEWVDQLFNHSPDDRGRILKQNVIYFHKLIDAINQGKDPTSEEVQCIIKDLMVDIEKTVDPSIVEQIADKIDLFEENAHLFESVIPEPIKTYSDQAVNHYYLQKK